MKTGLNLLSYVLMMLLMGTVYAWSVFRVEVENIYDVSALGSGLPYMTSLFFYALSMMITGRFLSGDTMRRFVLIGGILIGSGWLLSALTTSLLMLTISYGVIIGIGVGMVYGVPVFYIHRVYEERSGLYTGIVLSGFGASPLLMAPMIRTIIHQQNLSLAFLMIGLISLLVFLPLSILFKVNGKTPTPIDSDAPPYDYHLFWIIYMLFLTASAVGLMMIGLSYRIGVVNYTFNPRNVALMVSFFALLNGLARPIFGHLMDTKGFLKSATLSTGLMMLAAFLAIINQGQSLWLYIVSFGLFWFNLGAWLAMTPAVIKAYFGQAGYARRYGVAFTAYGLGALSGTLLSGIILDFLDDTRFLYGMIFLLALVMRAIIIWIKKRQTKTPIEGTV